jgi:hypothetical protein
MEVSKSTPIVILLDLDHTIQGDILPQINEFHLLKHLNENIPNFKIKPKQQLIVQDYMDGLLRPYFKRFITKIRSRFPNVEFFVYTASEKVWAQNVVKIIEKVIGCKINTRIFTRDDCILDATRNKYMKRISKISPIIFQLLKKKYNLIGNKNTYKFKHIFLIDNNYVLYEDEQKYLIKCETYDKRVVIDLLRCIPNVKVAKYYKQIAAFLFDKPVNSIFDFYARYYNMLKTLQSTHNPYTTRKRDTMWKVQLKQFKQRFHIT